MTSFAPEEIFRSPFLRLHDMMELARRNGNTRMLAFSFDTELPMAVSSARLKHNSAACFGKSHVT